MAQQPDTPVPGTLAAWLQDFLAFDPGSGHFENAFAEQDTSTEFAAENATPLFLAAALPIVLPATLLATERSVMWPDIVMSQRACHPLLSLRGPPSLPLSV